VEIVDIAGNVLASVERKQEGLKIHWEAKHHWWEGEADADSDDQHASKRGA
jgi:hypothetical protein